MHNYWKLFAIPGAIKFSAAAFLGRLPAGMIGLAIILPISIFTGSYTIAGAVAASAMIGMALGAPFSGRLVDRYGQHQILLIFAALNIIATSALIAFAYFNVPAILLCIAAAIAGASRLSTGTMARTRWAYVLQTFNTAQRVEMLKAAYAFESIVDEIVFICAPIFATLLCTTVNPFAGLGFCLLSYALGAITLAVQRSTQPEVKPIYARERSALAITGLQVVLLGILFIGISAGAVEVVVVARAADLNVRSFIGILMGTLGFSSILAGFWYGAQTFKCSVVSLWIRCVGILVLALVPFAFATNLMMLVIALFIAGLAIAPSSIAGQVLTEQILPSSLLNEGMNMIVTAMILGMAIGSWFSGFLIDKLGAYYAGVLPVLATLMALVIASVCARVFIPKEHSEKSPVH